MDGRERETALRDRLIEAFRTQFDGAPSFGARAPGRVNLIGEHTDYNQGWVLPLAIDRETWVVGAQSGVAREGRCRVWAADLGEGAEFELGAPRRQGSWLDYIQGVAWAWSERGEALRGCDLVVASDVPREAGLSSSAALGVAAAAAFAAANDGVADPRVWARVAHRAETEFVGVACGIMDPFASALCEPHSVLAIDCRTEETRSVRLPEGAVEILIAHSGVRRNLAQAESGYGDRVAECRAAFEAARAAGLVAESATALRDLSAADLPKLEAVADPVSFRRARHVVTENERVAQLCRGLEAASRGEPGALDLVGRILREGQRSLRDDFEVSIPELDVLCELGDAAPGAYGSRLTGAGMGGCTLHLVDPAAAAGVAAELAAGFESRFGRRPSVWRVRASAGAGWLDDFGKA